ncbi:MarR family winged helix-turn-helix transcriptional regulator [Streptomyces sp. NBC_00306]|uniref:MarR family winged helix-turn-helix transcriptional regulator n=1 Tax=Streptomyces sp. NBC_00306 TaxID=2975708 RepID=UPI002E2A4AA1|nr:MarR family transcriptional regulator [Streptomyces sp. NBC_00306]
MPAPDAAPNSICHEAAQAASSIAELLDVISERTKDTIAPASPAQLRLMYVVDRDDGIRMRAMCKIVASAPPNVSRMCDRLQAIGFLERLPCPDNRREITLRLTTAGKRHLQRLRQQRESMLHQAINSMPSTERRALAKGLAGLRTQLTAAGEEHDRPRAHSAA